MTANEDNKVWEEAELWFARRLDPSVREDTREAFERWYASDPRKVRAYKEAERLWDELASLQQMEEIRQSALTAAAPNRGWRRAYTNPLIRSPLFLGLAASLLIVVTLTLIHLQHAPDIQARMFATALGEQRTERLEDGTTLRLNTESIAEVRITHRDREVTLRRGEAVFDVAKDASRPFVVSAGDGRVTAVGTQFQVRSIAGAVAVTLMTGRVQVARISHQEVEWLDPGQQASFSQNGTGIVTRNVDVAALTSWMSGRLEFRGTPLEDVVAEANRYSARQIRIGDRSIGRLVVSGTFRTGDTDGIIAAFEAALPVRAERDGADVVLHGQ
jgi:transmembrane sensor